MINPRKVPAAGEAVISDLTVGQNFKVPSIDLSVPVRDPVGKVTGVAVVRANPDKIFSLFREDLLGRDRHVLLLDHLRNATTHESGEADANRLS